MRKTPARASGTKKMAEPPRPSRNSEHEMMKELKEMQMEMEGLKKAVMSETNIRTLESELVRELENMKKEIKENLSRNSSAIDKMEAEIKFLKEDMGRMLSLEKDMDRISAKSLERDIESLKAKSHWLETHMKGFDIDPIMEKISEIEDNIKIIKASQPVVWE